MHTDILVIGSGISGLTYAIKIAELNPKVRLILISKTSLLESNTRYAQGGIAVVSNFDQDSFEKHVQDTLIAGGGICDEKVVRFVVKEGKNRLDELIGWGTKFDTCNNQLHLSKEGGHSERRIVHYKDKTGQEIQKALIRKIKRFDNITLLEAHTLVDLITDHHHDSVYHKCYGAYIISNVKQEIIKITAQLTVLSTGGAGQLYQHTTNPINATGDGLGAAYRAKVLMQGLPFVQFHPTALYPKVAGDTFLISEAVRGEGAQLLTVNGHRFMPNYHPMAELAPRDVVARSITQELLASQDEYVVLSCNTMTREKFKNSFPTILAQCEKVGIYPPQDPIPVIPAAHYFCGGVAVNHHGKSQLNGLYAIGECSHTGLHGANRLASNSLLESLVFSHRAAVDSLAKLQTEQLPESFYASIPQWKGPQNFSDEKHKVVRLLKMELQATMTKNVGIFKTNQGLLDAEDTLKIIFEKTLELYNNNKISLELCELRNMVSVAYLMIKQSQKIKTNIGVFYNYEHTKNV